MVYAHMQRRTTVIADLLTGFGKSRNEFKMINPLIFLSMFKCSEPVNNHRKGISGYQKDSRIPPKRRSNHQ
jgi:hypothetical protein